MRLNKYFPAAFIYFFINTVGLPFGLTYTAILSPLLYVWTVFKRKKEILWPFFACLTPFVLIHISNGVDGKSFAISLLNLTATYIFCHAAYTYFKNCKQLEEIFTRLLIINFILCLIAIPFYFTTYYYIFWIKQFLTQGVEDFLRLKMFTYEASYYSTLMVPLFLFFFLQVVLKQNRIHSVLLLTMTGLPYLLSFSLGVITCIVISCLLGFVFYFRKLVLKKTTFIILFSVIILSAAALIGMIIFFPENALFQRIENVFSGQDISGKSRTFDAFYLATEIVSQKSQLWGIGPGQIKILGADTIRTFYSYEPDFNIIAIPNAAAETLLIFGWIGLFLRFGIQLFLFFYTRVWKNYYRLLLFLFMFTYQFTGSFITNIAEYVIWILAFTDVFKHFDIKQNGKVVNGFKNDNHAM